MSASERRVCLCTPRFPPDAGGVPTAAARLAATLHQAGYVIHVVTAVVGGSAGEVISTDENGVHVHRFHHTLRDGAEGEFAYRKFLQRLDDANRFDIFHGFFLTAAHPCLFVAERGSRRRPLIASIRGSDVATLLTMPLARTMLLPVLRKATWITSVNDSYLATVAAEVPVAGRSSVIRNGVPAAPPDASWMLTPASRGVVGTVGEFRKVKDIPLLVRGYAGIDPALRARLLLAGFWADEDEREWSETLIAEFNLRGEVEVTGQFPHPEVYAYLRRMHVYVQSSWAEGMPNALLEAASLGVPIVATAVSGLQEILSDGESALLVPHGRPAALSAAIERVLSNDALARALSHGARTLAASFNPAREDAEWLRLYDRLLA